VTAGRLAVLVAWIAFIALAVATRRRSSIALPDRAAYFRAWSGLHGGYDPAAGTASVRIWLTVTYRLARPLAGFGVRPAVVTLSGLLAAGTAALPAAAGGHGPVLAAIVLVLSGLLDNLDGAVAVLTDRTSAFGSVLDSVTDRFADVLGIVALGLAGAPAWSCLLAIGTAVLLEYTRARAGVAGLHEVGVVTVGERPSRVIVGSVALLLAGLAGRHADLFAGGGCVAVGALCAIGFGQFVLAASRLMRPDR
jgi:CDP-diacylglycerol--glycerol-3-phosphate 3-phosphatidyltransferase